MLFVSLGFAVWATGSFAAGKWRNGFMIIAAAAITAYLVDDWSIMNMTNTGGAKWLKP